jgi:hypothetical protein
MSRGRFYLRAESDEWEFVRSLQPPLPFDAAVISDRYLPPYPEGHSRHGEEPDLLVQSFEQQGVPWSVDPDTARLAQAKSSERQSPRAANRPLARAVPLPLTPDRFTDDSQIAALAEAAAVHQLRSPAFAAPYLEANGSDDPRFEVNLRLLAHSRQLAGDRVVVAYLQVLRSTLLSGAGGVLAQRLAQAGAEVIFVRVRRFEPESATPEEVVAYADLVGAGVRGGARVVADCVGRLGPVTVAVGADGFASNAWRFRKVPDDLHPTGGGGGAGELVWEAPRGGFAPPSTGSAVRCLVPECPAPSGLGTNAEVRLHNLHEFQRAAREAAADGLGYATRLAGSDSAVVRGWATALQSLMRRAA